MPDVAEGITEHVALDEQGMDRLGRAGGRGPRGGRAAERLRPVDLSVAVAGRAPDVAAPRERDAAPGESAAGRRPL